MSPKKRTGFQLTAILVLVIAALASGCTGYRTSSKISGSSGEVRLQTKEASGTDTSSVEINEDWYLASLAVTATFSVEGGSCLATLTGDDGNQLILDASAGIPASASGSLRTNAFGDLSLQIDCQGGQNLDLQISFIRQ